MENENEKQCITGKKVFFLNPPAAVRNQVINELVQHEIEIYIAKDHSRLARSLKKYPDSIVYINIDDNLPVEEWERWIANVLTAVPTVKIGIFSSNNDEEFKKKFISKFNVTCGYMAPKLDMSKTTQKIIETLETMDVKGRRKYIRASIEHGTAATINIPFSGEYLNGVLKDISIVGISCVFERDPQLKKNALHKDIQIRLQSMLLKVEAVVFGSRDDSGQQIYVFLFTQRIDPEVRIKIRKYIQQNLQARMDKEIS
ncbi:MAG: PilZ domain-containing protein [Treponema sp.]|nr:PilZ domain-containing protein [Treponema sp.]